MLVNQSYLCAFAYKLNKIQLVI